MLKFLARRLVLAFVTLWILSVIVFALDQPPHVQIAEIMVLPVNRY